ncbi:MAG: carboxy-S-adenosyl-L-methionine synthase CmoA [Spirochaetia bacterium]|nr:carboxy-S-adenosyl-L-methionine synthase CmoA [Spirochaetia bacterium]
MKDTLYKKKTRTVPNFTFSKEVTLVFDDMIKRSVPCYHETLWQISQLINLNFYKDIQIYDLGCSTGNLLFFLSGVLKKKSFSYTGIDSSPSMIEKAKQKNYKLTKNQKASFFTEDILAYEYEQANVFIANYVLQFVPIRKRADFIKSIYLSLRQKGVFILSEKIQEKDNMISNIHTLMHYGFKKNEGYSDIEIEQKNKSLKNILKPLTLEENLFLLKKAGFKKMDVFYKWCNFTSIIAFK